MNELIINHFEKPYMLYGYFVLPPPNYIIGKYVAYGILKKYMFYQMSLSCSIASSSILTTSRTKIKNLNKYKVSSFDAKKLNK